MERCRAIIAAAILLASTRDGLAQNVALSEVVVAIHDTAAVTGDDLTAARILTAKVFGRAGVNIEWTTSSACSPGADAPFCVQVLLRPRNRESAPGPRRVMGTALASDPGRAVLSLYFDAITAVALRYGMPRGEVLGLALAHEMGHVLLPPPSHAATGIMQPSWEGDDIRHVLAGDAVFTTAQALAIRARLASRR
jgi:hypothetical protein